MSEGASSGLGNNPVGTYNSSLGANRSAINVHVANLYVRYGGRDVGGITFPYGNHLIEQNTVEDTYEFGTLKNRHHVIKAIDNNRGNNSTIRNNTIINARQAGISVERDTEVYGNHVGIRSISTNSGGIGGYKAQNCVVYNNTIIARGEHPLGIAFVSDGTNNIEIYSNYIDSKTTALGDEYGGSAYCFDPGDSRYPCGNYAVGFRATWGGNNIRFYNNEIHVATDSYYFGTYSPTGAPVHVNAKGRGLMVMLNAGETSSFSNNIINVLDKDGTGNAFGISVVGNESDGLFIVGNTVRSNIANLVLSDEYGWCRGYPLFAGNHLIKIDNYPRYRTISNQLGGYSDTTGRIVDNTYSGGASVDSIDFNASGGGIVSVYFGTIVDDQYRYSYRYHDNNGASSVLLREDYNPSITLDYAVPENINPPSPDPIPGDINKDGVVNIFDYNIFLQHFGVVEDCQNSADLNGDCAVNIFDYNILLSNFGKTS
jgi:hypothetical protein